MHYSVVTNYDLQKLADMVNQAISEGYQPIGGISIAYHDVDMITYAQALIKK